MHIVDYSAYKILRTQLSVPSYFISDQGVFIFRVSVSEVQQEVKICPKVCNTERETISTVHKSERNIGSSFHDKASMYFTSQENFLQCTVTSTITFHINYFECRLPILTCKMCKLIEDMVLSFFL